MVTKLLLTVRVLDQMTQRNDMNGMQFRYLMRLSHKVPVFVCCRWLVLRQCWVQSTTGQ